jgi:hypothetical protein
VNRQDHQTIQAALQQLDQGNDFNARLLLRDLEKRVAEEHLKEDIANSLDELRIRPQGPTAQITNPFDKGVRVFVGAPSSPDAGPDAFQRALDELFNRPVKDCTDPNCPVCEAESNGRVYEWETDDLSDTEIERERRREERDGDPMKVCAPTPEEVGMMQQHLDIEAGLNTRAGFICEEAGKLVGGERAVTHGPVGPSFEAIAEMWNAYFFATKPISAVALFNAEDPNRNAYNINPGFKPADVAAMMMFVKMVRSAHGKHVPDHGVDLTGYAALWGQLREQEQPLEVDF